MAQFYRLFRTHRKGFGELYRFVRLHSGYALSRCGYPATVAAMTMVNGARDDDLPDVPLRERAASEIRAWMGRLRLAQKDVAAQLGISQSQVSARMNGRMEWSLSEIDELAKAWGLDALDLLAPIPQPNRPAGRELGPKQPLTRRKRGAESRCIPPWADRTGPRAVRPTSPSGRPIRHLRRVA
jgi:transcriptional regulator with XRE-family HTH domain